MTSSNRSDTCLNHFLKYYANVGFPMIIKQMKKRKTDVHFAIKKETTILPVGFFMITKQSKKQNSF
jgi:spermidine/putrescine-binding protein